ncbi:MAG: hypothetical protein ACXIUM_03230 [Wenzhouxiangella sp.]
MTTDPLNLRQLPALEAPPGLWAAIEPRLQKPDRPRWRVWTPAIAAALALAVAVPLWIRAPAPDSEFSPETKRTNPIQIAMDQSAALESELRARQQGSVSAAALEYLLLLETELAWVDLRLAEGPENLALWQQRGELLAAMILGYAEPMQLARASTEHW